MSNYKFLIGFVCGLVIGLIPPLVLMKMDSEKLNEMSARIAAGSEQTRPVAAPPAPAKPVTPPAPAASAAQEIQVHDITDIQDTWKTITLPASGTVLYAGSGKDADVPGVGVAEDRVVVIFRASAADHQALAQAIAAARAAKP